MGFDKRTEEAGGDKWLRDAQDLQCSKVHLETQKHLRFLEFSYISPVQYVAEIQKHLNWEAMDFC